ncbi:MAG TPA: hypothetical protein VM553_01965 [Dongiaceae bacterium]|nr:hypothetical protein [Dongiaceae bacterium]
MKSSSINALVMEKGGELFTAGTRFLTQKKWLRSPTFPAEPILGQGDLRFRFDPEWSKADRDTFPVNNCHEMAIDQADNLYLLTDHPRNNIIVYDLEGRITNSWTLNSTAAHGLTISQHGGVETLLISDSYNGRVVNTSFSGTVLRELPKPHALGLYSASMPYMPTQTAVAPNGDIYIADGYGSQCIIQLDAQGHYIRHFGGKGSGVQHLDYAHGITVDDRKGPGHELLLVTSRRSCCIKKFSLDGSYLGHIPLPKGYPCRPVIYGDHLLVSLCWSGAHLRPNSGFVAFLNADNQVVSTLGGVAKRNSQGEVTELVSDYSHFYHVHDVCPDRDGNVYVCQWNAGKTYPLKLERIR